MKRFVAAALFVMGLFVAGVATPAAAQTPAAPLPASPAVTPTGSSKIAVVAFQVAVGQTNEFQRAFLDLQKKWDPKQTQLKTQGEELDSQTKQLQTQAASLSDAERASRTKALEDKRKNFERAFEDARNDYQQEMQALYNNVATKVYDVMADYAQKNGYGLVIDAATQASPVLYAVETTDITKPIVDAYNVKSGVPAPAQPVATPMPAAKPPASARPAPAQAKPAAPQK